MILCIYIKYKYSKKRISNHDLEILINYYLNIISYFYNRKKLYLIIFFFIFLIFKDILNNKNQKSIKSEKKTYRMYKNSFIL